VLHHLSATGLACIATLLLAGLAQPAQAQSRADAEKFKAKVYSVVVNEADQAKALADLEAAATSLLQKPKGSFGKPATTAKDAAGFRLSAEPSRGYRAGRDGLEMAGFVEAGEQPGQTKLNLYFLALQNGTRRTALTDAPGWSGVITSIDPVMAAFLPVVQQHFSDTAKGAMIERIQAAATPDFAEQRVPGSFY
jgi:hypothetical protein